MQTAARLVLRLDRRAHIKPAQPTLHRLHWLVAYEGMNGTQDRHPEAPS